MKKILKFIAVILAVACVLPSAVFAAPTYIKPNADVGMPYASPTIDGTIEDNGSWSAAAKLNEDTAGYFWGANSLTSTADIYFAYDANGLYFAADIIDNNSTNSHIASTGYDDVDNNGSSRPYGFNGDVFILMLDPLGLQERSSLTTTVWYCVSQYSLGTARIYRSQFNERDITSSCRVAAATTSKGWKFEAFIPWTIIISDAAAMGSTVTDENLTEVGATTRAAAMYMDRYNAGNATDTWGRFVTVTQRTWDGYGGWQTSGISPKAYGLKLVATDEVPHNWGPWTTTRQPTCDVAGEKQRTCGDCGAVQKEAIPALGHTWGEWITASEPTQTQSGVSERTCSVCGAKEQRNIPPIGTSKSMIVAYYNASVSTVNEFTNIDVLNYHPATINDAAYSGSGDPIYDAYTPSLQYTKNRALAQNPKIKFIFTLASNNLQVFESWMANSSTRSEMVGYIIDIVRASGFDGVDIDYEFPSSSSDHAAFTDFMGRLRTALDNLGKTTGKQYILSMAVPCTQWAFSLFDMVSLQNFVDYFNVMNYDMFVNSLYTHHHTSPYDNAILTGGSVASDIQVFEAKGIQPNKLVMGCGMYARRWTNVNSSSTDGLYALGSLDNSNIHYSTLKTGYINMNGYVRYWDDSAKAPYLYNKNERIFISYDDEDSVYYKCKLVGESGVRGIMVFDYCTCDGEGLFAKMRTWLDNFSHTHTYRSTIESPATCSATGVRRYTCTGCGYTFTEAIPKTDHTPGDPVYTMEPTCTTWGLGAIYCTVCGQRISNVSAPPAHTWGEWTVVTEPTCSDGEKMRACQKCDATETEAIPATGAHSWGAWTEISAPGCEATGTKQKECEVCGATETGEIPALGHDYSGVTTEPTCTERGYTTYSCSRCTSSYQDDYVNALGHDWGEWSVTVEPTETEPGEKARVCGRCGVTDTAQVPPTAVVPPEVWAVNYTMYISNVEGANYMRYAPGIHTTTKTLRQSEGLKQYSARFIAAGTVDGVFSTQLASSGMYTVWIRYDDGREYLIPCDATVISDPEAIVNGLDLTITNLEGVRDFFVGSGVYDTYRDVKNNQVTHVTATAIGTGHEYTVKLRNNGDYTVVIRFESGRQLFLYAAIDIPLPEVTVSGMTISVKNMSGIKVVRVAPGTYTTSGDIKRAEGCRNYTSTSIKNADPFVVSISNEGAYSIAVQYTNGYIGIFNVEVIKTVPSIEKLNTSISFGDLDGLQVIRYAPGEYQTIGDVKRAAGAKYLRPTSAVNGVITVSGLDGTYTFAVQYTDGSVSVYTYEFEAPAPVNAIALEKVNQLFVDDYIIDTDRSTASRTLHSPVKKESVFKFNAAWESSDAVYHNIATLPNGTYRMYYKATSNNRKICYIESSDGLTWTRPSFSTYTYNNSNTNCVTTDWVNPDNLFVFYDTNPNCESSKRWKGIYGQWAYGLYLEYSEGNGQYFEFWPNEVKLFGSPSETGGCFFDTLNTVYWDSQRGKYVAFVRGFHQDENYNLSSDYVANNPVLITRDIRYAESTDCIHWTTPVPLKYSDYEEDDQHMYANCVMPYYRSPGLYVAIPTRYNITGISSDGTSITNAYTDNMFMASRDLVNWTRYSDYQYMMPGTSSLTYGDCYPCVGMIETPVSGAENEISLYMKQKVNGTVRLYRYALRLDGFASMDAPAAGASLVTKPVTFNGSLLTVNVNTGSNGRMRVIVTDMEGHSITSSWITGNSSNRPVGFTGSNLSSMSGKTVRITFEMENAELYSFKIS